MDKTWESLFLTKFNFLRLKTYIPSDKKHLMLITVKVILAEIIGFYTVRSFKKF